MDNPDTQEAAETAQTTDSEAVGCRDLVRHGADCKKVKHEERAGYLHAEDDDSPYDVDGLAYCGRCHHWMPRVPNDQALPTPATTSTSH